MRRVPDSVCIIVAWALWSSCSTAIAAAVVTEPTTLVELPWLSIAGGCLLSFVGGLTNTTRLMLAAANTNSSIPVKRQLAADTAMSLVLGLVTFAVVKVSGQGVYLLLAALPLAGYGGARVLDPAVDALTAFLASVFGKKTKPPDAQ